MIFVGLQGFEKFVDHQLVFLFPLCYLWILQTSPLRTGFAFSAISSSENIWLHTGHFVSKLIGFFNLLLSVIVTSLLVRPMVLVWSFELWFGWSEFVGSIWFFGPSRGSSLSLKSMIGSLKRYWSSRSSPLSLGQQTVLVR